MTGVRARLRGSWGNWPLKLMAVVFALALWAFVGAAGVCTAAGT